MSAIPHNNTLSIIIPAYNEEEAIGNTLRAALKALPRVKEQARLAGVELIVVSDGSSDRTTEIVREFGRESGEVRLIAYEKNRGYGAAIKTGFSAAKGDYLSFMDADGTCDPEFFARLVTGMKETDANIALGSRLHRDSKMPLVRRVGNTLYALLLSIMSGSRVHDSASGMRVIHRECLEWVHLLPDGLHFTPAMSSVAAFDAEVNILEVPMPYHEREGESKLRVVKDGFRFLKAIVETAYSYAPARFFSAAGFLLLALALFLSLPVISSYAATHAIREGLFYRIATIITLASIGMSCILLGVLANNSVDLIRKKEHRSPWKVSRFLNRFLMPYLLTAGIVFFCAGIYLVLPGLVTFVQSGTVELHWIFIVTAMLFFWTGSNMIFFYFVHLLQTLVQKKQQR